MNANQPLIWIAAKRMLKFVFILAALTLTAPLTLPYAAWCASGEDE